MKYAVNDHRTFHVLVKHGIRKATYQSPAIVLGDDTIHLGCAADSFNTGLYAAEELLSQAVSAIFILGVRLCDVLLGLRRNRQLSDHGKFGSFV